MLSIAAGMTDWVPRMVATLAAAVPAGTVASAWFGLIRSGRQLGRLEPVADSDAAAERARSVRAGLGADTFRTLTDHPGVGRES